MKERILKLREQGFSYSQIQKELKCSKSTISYHCGKGQKQKTRSRTKKRRENPILTKTDRFKYDARQSKNFVESVRKFQKIETGYLGKYNPNIETTFSWQNVVERFGEDTQCYLSGHPLNLYEDKVAFDHINPKANGGDNGFSNLGITHRQVNKMKSDLEVDELLVWCERILKHNGYKVEKI